MLIDVEKGPSSMPQTLGLLNEEVQGCRGLEANLDIVDQASWAYIGSGQNDQIGVVFTSRFEALGMTNSKVVRIESGRFHRL